MDKIKIELEHTDAENLHRLFGNMNYYMLGTILSNVDDDTISEKEIEQAVDQTKKSVNRIYIQLEQQLGLIKNT